MTATRWRCRVCGYVHEGGEPPEVCPVCGAPRTEFEPIDEAGNVIAPTAASEDPTAPPGSTEPRPNPKAPEASAPPVAPLAQAEGGVAAALAGLSYGLYVVASRRGNTFNAQTANTVLQVTSDPPRVALGINKKNLTHEFMTESRVAAVTILGQRDLDHVKGFGFRSGRDADKFAGLAVETAPTVKCPVLADGLAYLELKLDPERSYDAGTHTLFLADVVGGGLLSPGEPMTYAWYRQNRSNPPTTAASAASAPAASAPTAGQAGLAPDVANSITTLNLEFGANRRYQYQISTSQYPRLNAILEGVMRTECDHVSSALRFIEAHTPQGAKGFRRAELYLQLDLDFEKVATATYGKFTQEAVDPERKSTFGDMARSEAGHVNIFKQALEDIRAGRFPVVLYCELCGWEIDFSPAPEEGTTKRCARCGAEFRLAIKDGDWALDRLA